MIRVSIYFEFRSLRKGNAPSVKAKIGFVGCEDGFQISVLFK
jgi:hypothetical protein